MIKAVVFDFSGVILYLHNGKYELNNDLLNFIKVLKQKEYKIGILSNYSSSLNKELEILKIDNLFDAIITSGKTGFQKPDPKIFNVLFEELKCNADEVIFIDDVEESLRNAAAIGYKPILFIDNEQLFGDLSILLNK